MNGVQTRFKCKLDVKRCKRFVFPPSSLLPRSNALKTKAIRYFQTDRTLTRIVSPPLNGVYDRIHVKWLGEKPTFSIPTWLYFLLGALLLTALLLSIFVTIYKKRAKKGEILLKEENEKLNALLLENKNFLNRYQTVFNTTLVGLSYYDKKGILVSVNDEMARLF